MFQEALQFCSPIVLCYSKHIAVRVNGRVPPLRTWQISQIIVDCLSPIVSTCILNQSHGHWLLSDVLHFVISMSLKLKDGNKIILSFESLMEDNSIIYDELSLLAFNIRREVINVLDYFLSFLKKYENRKAHNMISLMLDPWFKSLHIVSSFVGREQGVTLVEEYDRKSLYPMLVKCHEHLHPLVRLDRNCVDQDIFEQDCSLDFLSKL
jgi:hypothetical protein